MFRKFFCIFIAAAASFFIPSALLCQQWLPQGACLFPFEAYRLGCSPVISDFSMRSLEQDIRQDMGKPQGLISKRAAVGAEFAGQRGDCRKPHRASRFLKKGMDPGVHRAFRSFQRNSERRTGCVFRFHKKGNYILGIYIDGTRTEKFVLRQRF